MAYILIIFAHVGMLGDGNSNSVTTAEYSSQATCEAALKQAEALSSGSTKIIKGVCTRK
jgi:hypothetical protein